MIYEPIFCDRPHPSNGVVYNVVSRPKAYDISVLEHGGRFSTTALSSILPVLAGCKEYSTDYPASLEDIAPANGGCVLTHLASGVKTFVEAKVDHYNIELDPRTKRSCLYHEQRALGQARHMITRRATWEFILITSAGILPKRISSRETQSL